MGVCPTVWMLLVGVLRITGTLLNKKRHRPKLRKCLLLYRRLPIIHRTPTNSIQSRGQPPIDPHLRKEFVDRRFT